MKKSLNLCDYGWGLYDLWNTACEQKELATKKNKALDRKVAGTREDLISHTKFCNECTELKSIECQ